ncbi:NACHT domain- and WD repeat-containing protein 1-like isoform X3 [Varroa destructor]|uniref:NWD1/2-like winged helix-turn-helix domain-containing protein n=1 Tax=Varroa destructor TaxID=109461 RepID=A0A7M7M3G2_VARDE|nr:NACHT domain- and WD repeat-containing protein 1-like isoform X3 [Varroa destructor]
MAQSASLYQDHILQAVLQGNLTSVPDPPARILKLVLSSSKTDFEHERRVLHEQLVPELQKHCASLGIDFALMDVQHFTDDSWLNPRVETDVHLREIDECHSGSLGCFLICLVGNKSRPLVLPPTIPVADFSNILMCCQDAGLDTSALEIWYTLDENAIPPVYCLEPPNRSSNVDQDQAEEDSVAKVLEYGVRTALEDGFLSRDNAKKLQRTCVNTRDSAAGRFYDVDEADAGASGNADLISDIILGIEKKNCFFYNISWSPSGVDPNMNEHAVYLDDLCGTLSGRLKDMVAKAAHLESPDWDELPPTFRKVVQEVVREAQTHLCNSREHLRALGVSQSRDGDYGPLLYIQRLMCGEEERARHSPIVVCGVEGSGKSTLLAQVLTYCPEWLGSDVVRVIRSVAKSPCSSYTAELLRNMCLHISMVFGFEISPKHQSFELGKLSVWFQDLLKQVETTTNDLVIILDDLDELKCPPSSQGSLLGWLPWTLPLNVHIIVSVSSASSSIMSLLKSRISSSDSYVHIPVLTGPATMAMLQSCLKDSARSLTPEQQHAVATALEAANNSSATGVGGPLFVRLLCERSRRWRSSDSAAGLRVPANNEALVFECLDNLEQRYGLQPVRRICSFLACTSYGFREPELMELLQTTDCEPHRLPLTWIAIKKELGSLLKRCYVDCRSYIQWSHRCISQCIKNRYLSAGTDLRSCHAELGAAFHMGFLAQKEDKAGVLGNLYDDVGKSKRRDDWSDILREVDETWMHLLQGGEMTRLKHDAVCNFEFLQCAVRGASVSYVRSVLEMVRSQLLDWEIEVVYNMTKQAVDVLSQDPQQLATEILNWLTPYAADGNLKVLEDLVNQANSWCQKAKTPLLVPQTTWLNLNLPPQVTSLTLPSAVRFMTVSNDSQRLYAVLEDDECNIQVYRIATRQKTMSMTGHKAPITCVRLTHSGSKLVTGSEDTTVIVFCAITGQLMRRLSYHVASIECLAVTHAEHLLISGSSIGVVVVSRLDSGQMVQRLENHRGMISAVAVNRGDDVFATASYDRTVCIWSIEDFTLLNTFTLSAAITLMRISFDSTFLLMMCEDNSIHVRSLTTGSEVHCLIGYTGVARSVDFARDNCRCIVGTDDGKAYIFDVHTGELTGTLSTSVDNQPTVALQTQKTDSFLFTAAGSKVTVWHFYLKRSELRHPARPKSKKPEGHKDIVTCVAVARDGSVAVTGSKGGLLKLWALSTGEPSQDLEGHTSPVTVLQFAHHGLFVVSASEDGICNVWALSLGLPVCSFKEHHSKIVSVSITADSRRILSVDASGVHKVWQADSGSTLTSYNKKPFNQVTLHHNIVFSIGGKNDQQVKYWPLHDVDHEKTVGHSDVILCYTVTFDGKVLVTGSQDKSLKVWEVATTKITQVLVGHEAPVNCVAVAPLSNTMAVSGSLDCNLIVWDMTTGTDNFILRGHTDAIKDVKLTLDTSVVISCSEDNTVQLWNTTNGHRVASFDLHVSTLRVATSLHCSNIVVQLASSSCVPLLRLLNNPAQGLSLETFNAFSQQQLTNYHEDKLGLGVTMRGVVPKRTLLRGELKREQSFDSLYWDHHRSSALLNINKLQQQQNITSQTSQHEGGISHLVGSSTSPLEELRRNCASPFGSREQLHLAGAWNGGPRTPGPPALRAQGSQEAMKPKMLPKHKILKKQQSMFACFPEFSQQTPPPLISPVATKVTAELADKKAELYKPTSRSYLARGDSQEDKNSAASCIKESIREGGGEHSTVSVYDSSVCVLM